MKATTSDINLKQMKNEIDCVSGIYFLEIQEARSSQEAISNNGFISISSFGR